MLRAFLCVLCSAGERCKIVFRDFTSRAQSCQLNRQLNMCLSMPRCTKTFIWWGCKIKIVDIDIIANVGTEIFNAT